MTLAERFWSKVRKTNGCWLWTASKDNHGYGQIMTFDEKGKRRPIKAHRVAFFLMHGRWPKPCGLHKCDTPACVRVDPGHVFEGTPRDNTDDMMRKGRHNPIPRRKRCKRGHWMTPENTKVKRIWCRRGVIARSCRKCNRLMQQRRRANV